jgi:acetolactate synthase-1/2/3 large subunit
MAETIQTQSDVSVPPVGAAEPKLSRVADVIIETLAELGVDTFYGIPGGSIASVYDALVDHPELRVINTRHETGAMFMAMGHSRVGGSLPCVLMTSGPGITNALTGLAAAAADGVPLIAIGGEVPKKNFGRGALQEGSRYQLDILGMVRSVTKFSAEITNARAASSVVRKAVATALSGRQGPVFLSLPLDVASERVAPTRASTHVATTFGVDDGMVAEAAEALQGAKRGLILVGSGCRNPEAVRLVGTLAATLQIPVVTTPKAKGLFPENDPLSLGIFGHGGHPSASRYLEGGIDVLCCLGCGLGETGTNSWSEALQPSAKFIQIDIDAGQIGKNYHVDVGLVGPAHVVLQKLVSRVRRRLNGPVGAGISHIAEKDMHDEAIPLKPARVLSGLQDVVPEDTIFTTDIGEHMIFALHYLRINQPDGFIVNSGLGAMGSGVASAIGAKAARPNRPVVAICGDFGFQMMGMELATCVQSGIGVVFAVFNDARMRMVESGLTRIFGRTKPMDSQRVDFAALARAVGARGITIKSGQDLQNLGPEVWTSSQPTVLDIEVDPHASFAVHGRVAELKNFMSN